MTERLVERSGSGLRESLFQAMDDLNSGKIDHVQAKTLALLAQTIVKTVEVQLQFETLRLDDKIPSHLGPMKLVPPLDAKL